MVATNVTVNSSQLTTVIKPGDKINLIFNKNTDNHFESTILLKNITVISKAKNNKNNVQLLLETPAQFALILPKFTNHGYFSIMLSSAYNKNKTYNEINLHHITHIHGDHTIRSSVLVKQEATYGQ